MNLCLCFGADEMALGFALQATIVYVCLFPFETADKTSFLFTWGGYEASDAFPFSDIMTLCDKTSAVCFRSAFDLLPTLP